MVKSPVRENRPPGSVRGAPGNRRPYRDPDRPVRFRSACLQRNVLRPHFETLVLIFPDYSRINFQQFRR